MRPATLKAQPAISVPADFEKSWFDTGTDLTTLFSGFEVFLNTGTKRRVVSSAAPRRTVRRLPGFAPSAQSGAARWHGISSRSPRCKV
jgi:hypothetical protein